MNAKISLPRRETLYTVSSRILHLSAARSSFRSFFIRALIDWNAHIMIIISDLKIVRNRTKLTIFIN